MPRKLPAEAERLARQYGVPYVDLGTITSEPSAVLLIPREFAQKHRVLGISLPNANSFIVAFADPSNIYVLDELAAMTSRHIEPVVAEEAKIIAEIPLRYAPAA